MAEQDFLCKLCAVIKANYFLFENYQRIVQLEAHFEVISYKFKRGLTLLTKNEAAFYCSFPKKKSPQMHVLLGNSCRERFAFLTHICTKSTTGVGSLVKQMNKEESFTFSFQI